MPACLQFLYKLFSHRGKRYPKWVYFITARGTAIKSEMEIYSSLAYVQVCIIPFQFLLIYWCLQWKQIRHYTYISACRPYSYNSCSFCVKTRLLFLFRCVSTVHLNEMTASHISYLIFLYLIWSHAFNCWRMFCVSLWCSSGHEHTTSYYLFFSSYYLISSPDI